MSISIAMVALGKGGKISASKFRDVWTSSWPGAPVPSKPEKKDNTVSFRVGDADIIYGLMPAPIPWSDLEGPCATSWLWPDASEQLRSHTKHVIVTVSSDASAIERARILTQATSVLLACCDAAIGVLWCTSTVVMPSKMFQDFAVEMLPDHPTPYIWVDFRAGPGEEGKTSGFTSGLSELGLMDMETSNSPEPPGELRDRFFGLATYLIENGLVIQDGNTIGESAEEQIRIDYVDSSFGHQGKVMRLDYEAAEVSGDGLKMTPYGCAHAIATAVVTLLIGAGIFSALSGVISSAVLRVIILVIPLLIFGFILMVISDKILNNLFGLQAFRDD